MARGCVRFGCYRADFESPDYIVSTHRKPLCFLNALLICWGAALIYFGVSLFRQLMYYLQLGDGVHLQTITIVLIFFGPVMIIMAVVGVITVVYQNRGWCNIFWIALLVIGLISLLVANYVFIVRNQLEDPLEESPMRMDSFTRIQHDNDVAQLWDKVQKKSKCCGMRGPEDYNLIKSRPRKSCCQTPECLANPTVENAIKRGCINVLIHKEAELMLFMGNLLTIAAFIMLSGAAYSCCMMRNPPTPCVRKV